MDRKNGRASMETSFDSNTMEGLFTKIAKRNGSVENFDADKITRAIAKSGEASGEFGADIARIMMVRVIGLA